jgi:hypothetical protein
MFDPYYKLSIKDKRVVNRLYEWGEDFGKEHGTSPRLFDYLAEHPDMTPKQMSGLVALNRGYEVQYELLNKRMFLEFNGLGYKSARPVDPALPRYHGEVISQQDFRIGNKVLDPVSGEYRIGNKVLDPVSGEYKQLDPTELARIHNDGGAIMKVDTALDVPQSNGKLKTSFVVLHGDSYRVGNLSRNPLEHYPGYSYRFYDNPYFINKVHKGVEVDGRVVEGKHTEAFRSAGSTLEAEGYLTRIANRVVDENGVTRWIDKDDGITEYSFTAANDMAQGDRVLSQKQTLPQRVTGCIR